MKLPSCLGSLHSAIKCQVLRAKGNMGSYNWIDNSGTCPVCNRVTTVRSQLHAWSSYSGNASGRFHDRIYSIGDTLAWFEIDDTNYSYEWHEQQADVGNAIEACYASCLSCGAPLCSVVTVCNFVVCSVSAIEHENNWPSGFEK